MPVRILQLCYNGRTMFASILILSFSLFSSTVYVDAAAPADGTGAKDRPFRSPVEAVRSLRGKAHAKYTILLADGTCELPDGLCLSKEDRDIVFSKAPGAGTVRFTRSIAATPGGKVACSAPPAPDTEIFVRIRPHAPLFFYDHAWAVPARWPNEDWAYFTTAVDSGLQSRIRDGIAPDSPAEAGSFVFDSDRPTKWNFDEGVWLAGYFTHDWSFERLRAANFTVTPSNRVMKMAGAALFGLASGTWSSEKGRRFYVYNVRAELDAPGEVYWDRKTGVVDFIPPKDGVTEFRAAVTEGPIVSATGASGIEFDGITFEYAAGDGLLLENCTNCGIFGCQVRNVGANGVTIRGGRSCRVRGSFIEGCGLGGADVSGGDRRSLTPCDHEIAGCTISRFGVLQRTYAPGVRVGGVGVHLAHNVFHDAPHSAVIYAGNDHLFEHNEVYGIMQETGDAGAFYSGRDPLSRGNVLRFNYVHDLGRPNDTAANTMAFYLDDCDAGDTLVSNRVKNVARGLMLGGGHDNHIIGNTFEDCAIGMSIDARGVVWSDRWDSKIDKSWQMTRKVKEMQVDREPWRSRYPLLLTYLEDGPREPRHIEVIGNTFTGCKRPLVYSMKAEQYRHLYDFRGNTADGKPLAK